MKIAHVVDSMEVGGAETLVMQMSHLQREQGHEVEIYAVAALGLLGEQMRASGFSVHSNIGAHLTDSSLKFLRLFRSSRPDVVHLHNPTPTIYAAPAARLARVSSIVSTRHSLMAAPRNATTERKYRVAAAFCDWIVGICDATVTNIRQAGSAPDRKVVRIYNGTTPMVAPTPEQRPEKTGFTLLYVGRLEPVKDLGTLLSAFRAAVNVNPDLYLWIVGDGTERDRLEKMAAGLGVDHHVRFWGRQLDVAPFFAAADAFIMSSISEGLPMSLLQAFSLGLPAIVTDVGGMGEVVRMAKAGLTAVPRSESSLSAAILRLSTDAGERGAFSERAKAAFMAHFQLSQVVAEYNRLYQNTTRMRVSQR